MFIGHFAVGFASKRAAPKASLGVLLAAPLLLDMIWPVFLLLGWEKVRIDPGNTAMTPLAFDSYPISHSLVMSIGWGALFALLYAAITKYAVGAGVIFLAVVSHWVLDWITHRPDLPLSPWSMTRVGLGLWGSVPGTVAVEVSLLAIGLWLYVLTTRARDRTGRIAFAGFVLFVLAFYVGAVFGPPPPDPYTLAVFSFVIWLFPFWAGWFDRHREVRLPG
jgi:membrane-bound metal-dependent hydrolase YbcI (DUF457 family)